MTRDKIERLFGKKALTSPILSSRKLKHTESETKLPKVSGLLNLKVNLLLQQFLKVRVIRVCKTSKQDECKMLVVSSLNFWT